MKNLGYGNLHIVSPTHYRHLASIKMTRGSEDLLESASFHGSLEDALAGYHVLFATSHRMRQEEALELVEGARMIAKTAETGKAAILFGSEKYGLARHDMDKSGHVIRLPVEDGFPSVNLAHAVAMVCLQVKLQLISVAGEDEKRGETPMEMHLTLDERHRFYREFNSLFARLGFDTPSIYNKIQQLFERANLTAWEQNLFYGLIKEARKRLDE
jgi:tRNA (cytidine32/uridine32-2'-O)-methyltransferase